MDVPEQLHQEIEDLRAANQQLQLDMDIEKRIYEERLSDLTKKYDAECEAFTRYRTITRDSLNESEVAARTTRGFMNNVIDKIRELREVHQVIHDEKLCTVWVWNTINVPPSSYCSRVMFSGTRSAFDVLVRAASQNDLFRFQYGEEGVRRVTSISGVANNAQQGTWQFYVSYEEPQMYSDDGLTLIDGFDTFMAENGCQLICWYR